MKKRSTIISLLFTLIFSISAFVHAQDTDGVPFEIITGESSAEWTGKKVLGAHNGTIDIQSGTLEAVVNTEDGFQVVEITGGEFVIDMNSLVTLDMDEKGNGKLTGHLKNADFFDVENHPTAELVITNVEKDGNGTYNITGDFTIKGITKTLSFPASVSASDDGSLQANADIVVDRTLFDIRYGSGKFFDNLGDRTINDNFELRVTLRASVGQ